METPTVAPPHIPYKVVHQEETKQLTRGNRFIQVWRVEVEDNAGHYISIEVPESEYNPARVDQLIEEKLEAVNGVHELGPEPHPDNAAEVAA